LGESWKLRVAKPDQQSAGKRQIVLQFVLSRTSDAIRAAFSHKKTVIIKGQLEYQACDKTVCYSPRSVPLSWELEVLPLDLKRSPEAIQHE
jgi:hypothetical protein